MPTIKQPTRGELFGIVMDQLDRSIHQPNILAYGQKDYPEQLRFHKCDKRGRYVAGSNRGGKTDALVVEAVWWASDTHPYLPRPMEWGSGPVQLRIVVVDVAKGIEQIMLPKMKRWIPSSYLLKGSWDKAWDSENFILTFANGSTIDFVTWGMDMMKLGGVPRHGIFFDEEPPRHIFNESMARLIDYNGFWVIAATPTKGMGWTFDLLWEPAQANPDGEVGTFTLRMEDNPYVQADEEDRDFYFQTMDDEERAIREKGEFVARSGLVFPLFAANQAAYVVPAETIDIRALKSWDWYSSTDFGWTNATAWLWHAVGPDGQIITFAEHYASKMTVAEHVPVVLQREAEWGKTPDIRVGDPNNGKIKIGTTGTSYQMEYATRGVYIDVDSIPRDVMIGIEKMQQYLRIQPRSPWGEERPMWVISSNCINFIREMKKLRWATYSSDSLNYDLNKQEVVHKKDDHAFDSARYFSTLMPDLTPDRVTPPRAEPITISYQDLLAKMVNDPDVEFVTETAGHGRQHDEPDWETTFSYGDLYEGDLIG